MSTRDEIRAKFRGPKVRPVETNPPQLGLNGAVLGVRAINAAGRLELERLLPADGKESTDPQKNAELLTKVVVLCLVCEEDGGWVPVFEDADAEWIKEDVPAVALLDLAQQALTFNGITAAARKEAEASFDKAPASSSPSGSQPN